MEVIPYVWKDSDVSVQIVLPYYEVRSAVEFDTDVGGVQPNKSLLESEESWVLGSNIVYTDEATRQAHFAVNGRDGSADMIITGYRCVGECDLEEIVEEETTEKLWSDPATWTYLDNRIPEAGEEVIIQEGWEVIYDIENSPIFKNIEVNGKLTWKRG